MTLRIESVELAVTSAVGLATYSARLSPGLNVLNAPNTWGKSTLLQSIIYGLGLEGSLSASRRSPLGPAMTQVIETSAGKGAVSESSVTVTVTNGQDQYVRVRRWGRSSDVDKNLVHVWRADSEARLGTAKRVDMFVRDPGSTTSGVGFHRLLEEFLGWSLPMVPAFSGRDTRLYLEVLCPLFYVEQKFGWSGIAPRVPTHYGLRDPLRRAVEYVLGLSSLTQLRAREALRAEDADIATHWANAAARAAGAAEAEGLRLALLTVNPVGSTQRRSALIEANDREEWLPLAVAQDRWRQRLADLNPSGTTAGQRTEQSRAELLRAERTVDQAGATVRNHRDQQLMSRADLDAIAVRLASIEADKVRLQDLLKIQRLGGELELPLLAEGRCPTCSQDVDSRDVATHTVSSVEQNVRSLDAERMTLLSMRAAAEARTVDLSRSVAVSEVALGEARDQVRLLRDELTGPSAAPSLAEVHERLLLEGRLRASERIAALVAAVDEELDELADKLDDVRARRASIVDGEASVEDAAILSEFRRSFQDQLIQYNLRSLPPREVTIDDRTLLPVNDGFELTFDVALGMSASDTIRTKWAYHAALLEAARSSPAGHHPGLLILDEPRQQETDRGSLAAFLQRLRSDSALAQIIYATSEDAALLDTLLNGIPHSKLPTSGPHLIDVRP